MRSLFVLLLLFVATAHSSETLIVAGGCFWCMEQPFEKIDGVSSAVSGYAGGKEVNPKYKDVASGATGHIEAVKITFDPKKVDVSDLIEIFWRQVDPTDEGGQFVDRGFQYSTAIFYADERQKKAALESKERNSSRYSKPIKTRIVPATSFYPAEEYHQDYYKKSTLKYKYYRYRSGRDQYLDKVWGKDREYKVKKKNQGSKATKGQWMNFTKPSDKELREKLNPMQYKVTQKDGTEPPFKNEFWDNKEQGIYVDIVSGEPLYSSKDKYKSGTGWPSFTRALEPDNIVTKIDRKLFMTRTEVRSKHGDSHLGHVFDDGPAPTGKRHCINSAALRFVPVGKLKEEGYEKYLSLFE